MGALLRHLLLSACKPSPTEGERGCSHAFRKWMLNPVKKKNYSCPALCPTSSDAYNLAVVVAIKPFLPFFRALFILLSCVHHGQ